ncbi:insulinoma-associated protein 1 [Ditylenchus destructor]|nr:insulinoma-associated protein 1 [Ditylenchus destructor]
MYTSASNGMADDLQRLLLLANSTIGPPVKALPAISPPLFNDSGLSSIWNLIANPFQSPTLTQPLIPSLRSDITGHNWATAVGDCSAALQLLQLQLLLKQQSQNHSPPPSQWSLDSLLLATNLALQNQKGSHESMYPKDEQAKELSPTFSKLSYSPLSLKQELSIVKTNGAAQINIPTSSNWTSATPSTSSQCSSPNSSPPSLTGRNSTSVADKCAKTHINRKRKETTDSTSKADVDAQPTKKRLKQKKRLLKQDDETNSPVSGMFIRDASDVTADEFQRAAELDDTASYVHISEESRAIISEIPNVIGDTICSLCKVKYEDVFRLAMHRCPRIMHEEYRCPECEKTFSCPANLASHRRWHRPKMLDTNEPGSVKNESYFCSKCSTQCDSKTALKVHRRHCGRSKSNELDQSDPSTTKAQNESQTASIASIVENGETASEDTSKRVRTQEQERATAVAALISLGVSPTKAHKIDAFVQ